MKTKRSWFALLAALIATPASAQSAATAASGTGLYVAPTSAAYALLTNAAKQMLTDVQASIPKADTLIIYDQPTFGSIPYYRSALENVKASLTSMCAAANAPAVHTEALDLTGLGTAASGLASLIGLTLPAYAIQGQAVTTIDNTALIGAVAAAAQTASMKVINPAYVLPANHTQDLKCQTFQDSSSLADVWAFAAVQAKVLAPNTGAAAKAALAQYQKIQDVFLAADKGVPLLSKLLIVESLIFSVADPSKVAVIDMKLDGVGIDSTTRTILWWRTTKFSSNVVAHYAILTVPQTAEKFTLTLVKPGYVNFMLKDVDQKGFASSAQLQGKIN